jgi:CubicO group peptidase (beta-lactamase class C family)
LALTAALPLRAQEEPVFDIPQVSVSEAGYWDREGFLVDLLLPVDGKTYPIDDGAGSFELGWDEHGLRIRVYSTDDIGHESENDDALWNGDSIELFVATERGGKDRYQVVIAAGHDIELGSARTRFVDFRQYEPREELAIEVTSDFSLGCGYELLEDGTHKRANFPFLETHVLLPWSNLGITPEIGREFAFQLYVNDMDEPGGPRRQLVWYPATNVQNNTNAMYRIRLAKKASSPYVARVSGSYDEGLRTNVRVVARSEFVDRKVTVRDGRAKAAVDMFHADSGFAAADLLFDMPERGLDAPHYVVRSRGAELGAVSLPDADVIRAQRIMFLPITLKPPVFAGENFPEAEFAQPLVAERLFGACTFKTTYYDRDYNVVERATQPGRYGAVVEITPDYGPPLTRYFTLFRAPDGYNPMFQWWFQRKGAMLDLPATLGIDPSAQEAQSIAVGKLVGNLIEESVADDHGSAVLLAGLYESDPGMNLATVANDAWAADRQWWVGLKRRINGTDKVYPNAFVCPHPKEGDPATVLRLGTPEEAGMKPEVIAQLDALFNEWVEASGEPFAVCLTRHGVIYYHKAFGQRDGQPITVDTKSWMASISKFLSGTLMMTLVDQGFVDLDAPVDTYLPEFRGIDVETPLTIRHLYTHTNGFQLNLRPPREFYDHWGDDMNDLEHVLAGYYPYLEVATRHGYNGVGFALGGKVMETVTGEALPQLFRNHLWGPLGCDGTDAVDGSARTFSTPMDMAIFGQMMLNKGAYGNMRFFSEETFEKALPVKLAPYVNFDTDIEWGVGGVWMRGGGLSDQTFGHGAASAATLRIDPVNDLVVVMTRNSAGPKFGEYHEKFLETIVAGMAH